MSTRRKYVIDGVMAYSSTSGSSVQSESLEENVNAVSSSGSVSNRCGQRVRTRSSSEAVRVGLLSHPTARQLQAQLEAENQEVRTILKPILDAENGLIKDLDGLLCRRDAAELRRKELLHKRWTERVWLPVQRGVENHVSRRCCDEAHRLRSLYADYIRHCNAKGFVSLDCYDPQEYDPFLLSFTGPHRYKLQMPALKDPLFQHARERLREKRAVVSCQTGRKHTRGEVKELLAGLSPTPPQTDPPQTSSSAYLTTVSTTGESAWGRGTQSSHRPNLTPYWITATCTADGKCYQACCWSSRR